MNPLIKIYNTQFELAEDLALDIISKIKTRTAGMSVFAIALSGGTTPRILFTILGDHYGESVSWENVHIFWADERCVPPGDAESNYRMAKTALLGRIKIPARNIHRIRGEDDPVSEASRYSEVMREIAGTKDGFPMLDIILLGVGEDGHVASIFPGNEALFNSDVPCHVARHPETGQNRITVSGSIINNSRNIFFMVTGKKKAQIVSSILEGEKNKTSVPASYVCPAEGAAVWYLDREAASLLHSDTID